MNKEVLLVKLCQNKIMLFHSFLNFENILVFLWLSHTKCLYGTVCFVMIFSWLKRIFRIIMWKRFLVRILSIVVLALYTWNFVISRNKD